MEMNSQDNLPAPSSGGLINHFSQHFLQGLPKSECGGGGGGGGTLPCHQAFLSYSSIMQKGRKNEERYLSTSLIAPDKAWCMVENKL